jgi:hypothetical protein
VGSYLGDGIAMQMQTTLPLFFGPRWKPPVGWNPVMHPPENSARKRPLLTPVGSPQEAMFLYFYTRLKLRDLLAFCQGREGDSVCLEALGRAYQQEVEVMLVTDRWQRFKLARQHWGTLRALNFLLTVDEQNLRLPNLEAMLVDCHRRISSLYHLRFHARVLLGQLGGVEFTNPDQFRSAEWKPFVFERHFGRDTAIALVEKQLQLNSEFPVMAGDHPLIWGFRYEFQVGARFPDPAPSEQ